MHCCCFAFLVVPTQLLLSNPTVLADGSKSSALERATEALGGETALLNLSELTMESSGTNWVQFEGDTPDDLVLTTTFERTVSALINEDKLRVDTTSSVFYELLDVVFPGPQAFSRIIDGKIGYSDSNLLIPEGTIPSDNVAALKRQFLLLNPHPPSKEGTSRRSN